MTRRNRRAGFSLIEVLVVLAIMAISAALVFPMGGRLLDRIAVHAAFFDFQRQLFDARRQAFRGEEPFALRSSDAPADASSVAFDLMSGWSYALEEPLQIGADGRCSPTRLQLLQNARPVATLEGRQGDCRLIRID